MKLLKYEGKSQVICSPVLRGKDMPRNIQIAYGRFVFRLFHSSIDDKPGVWLRDLPLSLETLAR